MAGLENIIGGFARGYGQGQMMKLDREREKENNALKKQMYQIQIQAAKTKQGEHKLKQDFMNAILSASGGGQAPGGQAPDAGQVPGGGQPANVASPISFGSSFQEGKTEATGGVTDIMAQIKTNPLIAAVVGEATDINLLGAGRNSINQARFEREGTQKKHITMPTGEGGSNFLEIPKYGSAVGEGTRLLGQTPPGVDFEEKEEGGVKYRRKVNKLTKKPTSNWEAISGKKGMTAESAGKLAMVESGLSDLQLAKNILLGKDGEVTDDTYKRLMELSLPGGGLPWSQGREARSYILNSMEGKIRIESGAAVPDTEMARLAERFMPSVLDSKKLIKAKMDRLESYLAGVVEKLDPNKNYSANTLIVTGENGEKLAWTPGKTGMKKKTLPAAARGKLREGVHTTFGNGQVWTIKDGEPARIE